jgi:hypothetical protein
MLNFVCIGLLPGTVLKGEASNCVMEQYWQLLAFILRFGTVRNLTYRTAAWDPGAQLNIEHLTKKNLSCLWTFCVYTPMIISQWVFVPAPNCVFDSDWINE